MFYRQNRRTSGFTLVELAIVLGVAGVLFGGLWRLLSTSNQQMRDQATANQHAQVVAAVSAYLQSSTVTAPVTVSGQDFLAGIAPNTPVNLLLPTAAAPAANSGAALTACAGAAGIPTNNGLCTFLPVGFSRATVNPYGQQYRVRVWKDSSAVGRIPASYSFVVMTITTAGETIITDTSGGRISALIGGDGGFIYNTATCGATPANACGSYGAWTAALSALPPNGYGFAAPQAPAPGHVASRTFVSSSQTASDYWLARRAVPGDAAFAYNTMTTPFYFGGQPVYFGSFAAALPAAPSTMYLGTNGRIMGLAGLGNVVGPSGGTINLSGNARGIVPGVRGDSIFTVNETSGCKPAVNPAAVFPALNVDPALCNFTVTVVGSMSVTGFLYADNFYSPAFGYFSSSDRRLKTNIMPLSGSLAKIMEIKPVSFTLKEGGKEGFGVIAQDLEKIYPQLVSDGPNGYKAVAYTGLIGPLVEAVQELKKQNDELRDQLHTQEQSQRNLIQQLEKLQKK